MFPARVLFALCLAPSVFWTGAVAQSGSVTANFVVAARTAKGQHPATPQDVLLWLTPVDEPAPALAGKAAKGVYRLVQKDKMFSPRLLVVPAGSNVEFPNLDPFFHNVFSLFDGRRFDLGLYEAGTHRTVRFDREGVSYIFCNIHPEMGAIVVALKSPYFALSDKGGRVTIRDVPAGQYRLHVWAEQMRPSDATLERRIVQVGADGAALGPMELTLGPSPLMNHKNKFGEDYPAPPHAPY